MTKNFASVEQQLVDLLGSAASYNDKGAEWCGHSPAKVEEMQSKFHRDQLALVEKVGAERVGPELLSAIRSGAASRDWSGEFARLAEQVLRDNRSRA
jgi:hypothetical protein